MRPPIDDVLITKSLILVDDKDVPRLMLHSVNKKEGVCLELRDSKGLARLQLNLDRDGNPNILFLEKDGSASVSIGVLPDSRTGIEINSQSGSPAIMLLVHPDGERHFEILDDSLTSQCRLP